MENREIQTIKGGDIISRSYEIINQNFEILSNKLNDIKNDIENIQNTTDLDKIKKTVEGLSVIDSLSWDSTNHKMQINLKNYITDKEYKKELEIPLADENTHGLLSCGDQTIKGKKTFINDISLQKNIILEGGAIKGNNNIHIIGYQTLNPDAGGTCPPIYIGSEDKNGIVINYQMDGGNGIYLSSINIPSQSQTNVNYTWIKNQIATETESVISKVQDLISSLPIVVGFFLITPKEGFEIDCDRDALIYDLTNSSDIKKIYSAKKLSLQNSIKKGNDNSITIDVYNLIIDSKETIESYMSIYLGGVWNCEYVEINA